MKMIVIKLINKFENENNFSCDNIYELFEKNILNTKKRYVLIEVKSKKFPYENIYLIDVRRQADKILGIIEEIYFKFLILITFYDFMVVSEKEYLNYINNFFTLKNKQNNYIFKNMIFGGFKNDFGLCGICLDKNVFFIQRNFCKHTFHKKCLDKMLVHNNKNNDRNNCPVCRTNFETKYTIKKIAFHDEISEKDKKIIIIYKSSSENILSIIKTFDKKKYFLENEIESIILKLQSNKNDILKLDYIYEKYNRKFIKFCIQK